MAKKNSDNNELEGSGHRKQAEQANSDNSKNHEKEQVLDPRISSSLGGFIEQLKKDKKISDEELRKIFSEEVFKSDVLKPAPDSLPVYIFDNSNLSALEAIVKYMKEEKKYTNKKIATLLNRSEKTIWVTYRNASKKQPGRFQQPTGELMQKSIPPENYFRLHNGQQLRNFDELLQSISLMDDDVFNKYVNQEKNDFCNWVSDVLLDIRIAEKLRKAKGVKAFLRIAKQQLGIKKLVNELKNIWIPTEIFVKRETSVLESIVLYLKDKKNLTLHQIATLLNRDDRTVWTVLNRAKKKK